MSDNGTLASPASELVSDLSKLNNGTLVKWTKEKIVKFSKWFKKLPYGSIHYGIRNKGNSNFESEARISTV
jgi:hypothetical protein